MVKPTIAGVAFLSFLFYWGDYVSPLLYLQTEDHYTLAVVLQLLRQMSPSDWSLLLSAAVYMMFFPFLFFIFIQKRIGDG
jgi:multiple sugar transport system permease protein